MSAWEIDRSGILSYQKCPRDRFLSRHFNGMGIERVRKSLPLTFGSAFHAGAEALLNGDVEGAVAKAVNYLNLAFSVESVDLEEKQTAYAVEEQKAIVEGLIRGWWAYGGEDFLRNFEVIEVEREGRAALTSTEHFGGDAPWAADNAGIVLMFRPDALVRERMSGDLYVVSWKTASTFGQYTVNQIGCDMQSMSEAWGIMHGGHYGPIAIEGILYLFAVKGQRRMDDYLGFKVQDTPLAYGWVRKGATPEEDEWAWRYKWATEEMNPKTGKPISTQLGKGFRKVSIWDNYPGGVKAWIDDLAAQRIAPRHLNALEGVFPQSMPVSRRADEIESWRRQVVGQETRIVENVDVVTGALHTAASDEYLDHYFPQHTARCLDYRSKCQFWEACHVPAVKADPLGSGIYQIRTANHPEGKEADDD